MSYVRIVQPSNDSGRFTPTQGTKVLLEDGSEIEGVYKIVLTAEVNSLWSAEIHCHPHMTDLSAWATIHKTGWWLRLRYWLTGKV